MWGLFFAFLKNRPSDTIGSLKHRKRKDEESKMTNNIPDVMKLWHTAMLERDTSYLDTLLADDVVFPDG